MDTIHFLSKTIFFRLLVYQSCHYWCMDFNIIFLLFKRKTLLSNIKTPILYLFIFIFCYCPPSPFFCTPHITNWCIVTEGDYLFDLGRGMRWALSLKYLMTIILKHPMTISLKYPMTSSLKYPMTSSLKYLRLSQWNIPWVFQLNISWLSHWNVSWPSH